MAEMLAPCAAPLAAQDLTMQSTVPFVLTEADLIFLKVNRISPE